MHASKLKEYKCVQVGDHKSIGKTIEKWQKNGWRCMHATEKTIFQRDFQESSTNCKFNFDSKMARGAGFEAQFTSKNSSKLSYFGDGG